MPTYKVRDPQSGRTVTLRGDTPPTEADLDQVFAQLPPVEPKARAKDWFDTAAEWLPTAAATAGGVTGGAMSGGLAAIPAAGVFGAAGKGLQNVYKAIRNPYEGQDGDVPQTIAGNLGDIALEGGVQAAAEGGGQLLAKGLKAGASSAYRRLLKPSISERLAPRAREIVQTGLETGTNPYSTRSLGKLEPAISHLNEIVESTVRAPQTTAAGHQVSPIFDPKKIALRVQRVADKFAGAGADPADRAAAARVPEQFLDDLTVQVPHPGPPVPVLTGLVNPATGQPFTMPSTIMKPTVRQIGGEELLASRRATGASTGATSFGITRGAETEARKELYHHMGQELGDGFSGPIQDGKRVFNGLRDVTNTERRLIDLKDAAVKANDRNANQGLTSLRRLLPLGGFGIGYQRDGGSVGTALGTAAATELLINPRLSTRAALLAFMASKHPRALANLGRTGIQGARSALSGSGASDEE